MHWSKLFIPTLRDDHPLLERAGHIRQFPGGIYSYLFLGQRALLKITKIVREEMDSIGAQEFHLPVSKARPEEAMVSIARGLLRSYKQLPQIWFTKTGSCSFDITATALDISYEKHRAAYSRIFDRCGLEYIVAGGDFVVRGANYVEIHDPDGDLTPEEFHTPNVKTIIELARFTGLPETSQMKSVVMVADGEPVLVLLRGDHQLDPAKLATEVRAARPEEIRQWFGADGGSLGPIGVAKNVRIIADDALRGRRNMIAGANRNDYHLRNVTPGEDFEVEFHDLRQAAEGDASVLGQVFKLGDSYAQSKDLHVTNESGKEIAPFTGTYGIDIERILSAAVGGCITTPTALRCLLGSHRLP